MATLEQENQARQEVLRNLTALLQIKLEELGREDLGRELNFKTGMPYFERSLKLFRELSESNLDSVPYNKLNPLNRIIQSAIKEFNAVKSFSVQQHSMNPAQSRDQIINTIRDAYDNYFDNILPLIAYSTRIGLDFGRLESEARKSIEKLNALIVEQEKSRTSMISEIEGTVEKVRRAAHEVGVAQHAVHFMQEASEHKRAASRWLLATAITALITIIVTSVSLYLLIDKLPSLDFAKSIQLTVAKLVVFSLLFSSIIWMGRIYRSHRHNYVVNKHRQNALSTFETFVKAANDDQTKSAVLLQTTNCIFSPQHTGYISHEPDAAGYPQIMEIIRGASGPQNKPQ